MPPKRKPPGTAVDRRNGAKLSTVTSAMVERFDAPDGLLDAALAAWEGYWDDRQSGLLTSSSKVVLLRWIDALDRYLRTIAEADREPLVTGSTGQLVVNPLYKVADSAKSTVESCERQLGIGGMNAANLGLAAVQEAKSLADMNARYEKREGDSGTPPDPRLHIVQMEA